MNRLLGLILAGLMTATAWAGEAEPIDLDQLLQEVKQAQQKEARLNREREARFLAARDDQAGLLAESQEELARLEALSQELQQAFDGNEQQLAELQQSLDERAGELGEASGTVRQVAGDLRGVIGQSLISAQYPGREVFLGTLAESRHLPSLEALEQLWFTLQQQMTEAGKVARFRAPVVGPDGSTETRELVRVGEFNAVTGGRFLRFLPESQQLIAPARQPPARERRMAEGLANAVAGYVDFPVDPTRGALLDLLVQTPELEERARQGGAVGYLILGLGAIGLLIVLERLVYLGLIGARIRRQLGRLDQPASNNPLGRVLLAYDRCAEKGTHALERALDEAILKETPRLERGRGLIKLLAAVAPLLGLLGTVIGMIATFQAITLFGTGDPRLMAGGISQALVTTAQGLIVAIPLVFLHSLISARSNTLIQLLDEQSAGLIARRMEGQTAYELAR